MPRKPSSIYLIVEHPTSTMVHNPAMPDAMTMGPTNLQAWRVELEDGEELKDVAKRAYQAHPIGSTITVVEDTKVQAFTVGLTLDELDDPRLPDEALDEEPPTP